jgi:hypothetical protein
MQEVDERAEDARWETFIRELSGLMNASPAIREQFIRDARPREKREGVLNWAISQVFPILTIEKRQRFVKFMHVLES